MVVAAPLVFICLYVVAFLSGREAEGPCVRPVVVGAVFIFDCFCGGMCLVGVCVLWGYQGIVCGSSSNIGQLVL